MYSIAFGGPAPGLFVALNNDGSRPSVPVVLTSTDGNTWTVGNAPQATWSTVTWGEGPGVFVAFSSTGQITQGMYSPDGFNWTAFATPADLSYNDVAFGGPSPGLFVAVTDDGFPNGVITSPDGINWTNRTTPVSSYWWQVEWGQSAGLFVAIASDNTGYPNMVGKQGLREEGSIIWMLSPNIYTRLHLNIERHPHKTDYDVT